MYSYIHVHSYTKYIILFIQQEFAFDSLQGLNNHYFLILYLTVVKLSFSVSLIFTLLFQVTLSQGGLPQKEISLIAQPYIVYNTNTYFFPALAFL